MRTLIIVFAFCALVSAQDFDCPEKSGFYADPYQCDLYYKCSKGKAETKLCPDGLVFADENPNKELCDIPSNVDCGDRKELQEPKPTKGCPRQNGYFKHPDPQACDKFYYCSDGIPNELPCPPGLYFDEESSNCDWKELVQRQCDQITKDTLDDGFSCPDGEVMGPNGRPLPHPTFPHPEDCQKFYICRNGFQPQKGSCPSGKVYNEDTFMCDQPYYRLNVDGGSSGLRLRTRQCCRAEFHARTSRYIANMRISAHFAILTVCFAYAQAGILLQNAPACPEQHGVQAYAHPELCDQFFLCTNGTLTVETCENGLLFDGKGAVHNHCNYHWAVDCGEKKADLTPYSTPGCEYQFGIYPDSAECSTSYIKCAFGVPHQEPCTPGLVYDERIHGCNWPDLLQPFCNPEAVVGFKCPTKVPAHTQSAKFWPFPRFAVPGDCHHLITCVEGNPRLIACGEGKVFDDQNLTCEDPELVPHCGHA